MIAGTKESSAGSTLSIVIKCALWLSLLQIHSYFSKVVKAQREFVLSFTCVVTPRTLLADSQTQSKGGVFKQSGAAGWLDNAPDSKHWLLGLTFTQWKVWKLYTLTSMSWCNPASRFSQCLWPGMDAAFFSSIGWARAKSLGKRRGKTAHKC